MRRAPRVRAASRQELLRVYLQVHLEEWVLFETLRWLLRFEDGSEYRDMDRALRDLRALGWTIDLDRKLGLRLRAQPMNTARGDGRSVTGKQRLRILARDGGRCQLCGVARGDPAADGRPARLQIDHIVERQENGPTVDENLRTLCHVCNHDRTSRGRTRPVGSAVNGKVEGVQTAHR